MSFLEDLGRELRAAGIRGRRRARILAEFADHLSCDPEAELGEPAQLARQFADELGTTLARRAGFHAFGALAVAGILFTVGFLTGQTRAVSGMTGWRWDVGYAGAAMALVGCQVAFVAGVLAALRAFRHRGARVVSRQEAVTIVRRAGLGLLAGVITMTGFGLAAVALWHHAASWWTHVVVVASGVSIVLLVAAAPAVISAARLRPTAAGPPGDLYEDFGPLVPGPLQGSPWRFALAVAGSVAVAITAAGVIQSDPFDGAFRGLADGAACLTGFAILGRYLGLRR